ncbi:MAG: hypothetical protein U0790_19235 [Isosphaeraceae bacterium]
MPVFAERMKDLTDHLRDSIEHRGVALGEVHQATQNLLGAARTFMDNVTLEHHHRADELHEMLDEFRDDLQEKVKEMRRHHREHLHEMRAEMRHKLDENRATRHKTVKNMRHAFAEARLAVADDLRAAGHEWREFTVNRHAKEAPARPAETRHASPPPAAKADGAKPRKAKESAPKSKPRGRAK